MGQRFLSALYFSPFILRIQRGHKSGGVFQSAEQQQARSFVFIMQHDSMLKTNPHHVEDKPPPTL